MNNKLMNNNKKFNNNKMINWNKINKVTYMYLLYYSQERK